MDVDRADRALIDMAGQVEKTSRMFSIENSRLPFAMARGAYAVFVFHAPIIVTLSYFTQGRALLHSFAKLPRSMFLVPSFASSRAVMSQGDSLMPGRSSDLFIEG